MNKYEVIIYWSEQDEAFVAEVPKLPGCAAHGATQEAPPGLPVAEEPFAISEGSAEVDRGPAAEDDSHRVRDERRQEEPQGLRNGVEGHRGQRTFVSRI